MRAILSGLAEEIFYDVCERSASFELRVLDKEYRLFIPLIEWPRFAPSERAWLLGCDVR